MADSLAFWSLIALVIRVIAIVVFIHVMTIQVAQFKFKSRLQPLKWLLLGTSLLLILMNVPIIYLHWLRIFGQVASGGVTSFATVTNAAATLLVAIFLLLIYRFRVAKDDGE